MNIKRIIPAIFLFIIGIFVLLNGIEIISDYIASQSTIVDLSNLVIWTDDKEVAIFAICCVCAFAFVVGPLVTAWIKEWIRERRRREKKKGRR